MFQSPLTKLRAVGAPWSPLPVALLALLFAASCSSSDSPTMGPGYYVSIANLRFSPLDLKAPPGATVTVLNDDSMEHSVTSEATVGAFTPGAVAGVSFDTGAFTGDTTFVLPANAPNGTVIPYFCTVHTSTMATPNGSITVDVHAQPQAAPGTPVTPGPGMGYGY
jgi:plastocyanin